MVEVTINNIIYYTMRVALCISGHARNVEQCYPNIKSHILDHYKPDVFISTWSTVGYWSLNEKGFDDHALINKHVISSLYAPKILDVENYDDHDESFKIRAMNFKDKLEYPTVRAKNIISMWYKIHKCNSLKTQYELTNNFNYDLVIRARFDLLHDVLFPLHAANPIIYHNSNNPSLYGDCFFMAPSSDMNVICDMYNHLEAIDCKTYAHTLFKTWINTHFPNITFVVSDAFLWNTQNGYCT